MRLFLILLLSYFLLACVSQQGVTPGAQTQEMHFVASDYIHKPISVTIENGFADFHNIDGYAAYEPIVFVLKEGQVVTKSLTKTGNNFFNSNAKITLRYNNGILYIDVPSPENAKLTYSGVQFKLNKDWLNGGLYKDVNTDGFCNLRNADITIKLDQ